MDQTNQGNNPGAPADVPVKRKRGRPRKDPSKKRVEKVRVPLPPGFAGVNGNQPNRLEAVEIAHDAMVGQPVSGVVEAAFDAGYLLNVRVGNTDITLRGVVFKPGRYVPISSENDLAPNVQMIRRNEIPLPRHGQIQVHGKHGIRHRNGTSHLSNESQSANKVSKISPRAANTIVSKGKQVPALPTQIASPLGSRGNVVPVLLQPVNLSNGINTASPAPHLASSKCKQVPLLAIQAPPLSNGPPLVVQVPDHNQTNHQTASTSVSNEGSCLHQPMAEVMHDAETKPGCSVDIPFQTLLDEVIKRKSPSQPGERRTENINACGKISVEDSGFTLETGVPNMNEPLSIKPLQAFQPDFHEQPVSILAPTGNERNGKMTELLQV